MKFKCIKEGRMEEGHVFAYKGNIYEGYMEPEIEPGEGPYYEIHDELWDDHYKIYHGMDQEFFDEYFIILLPEVPETHLRGLVTLETEIKPGIHDFGIQISKDGRVWICIDGQAFMRFKPVRKDYENVDDKS